MSRAMCLIVNSSCIDGIVETIIHYFTFCQKTSEILHLKFLSYVSNWYSAQGRFSQNRDELAYGLCSLVQFSEGASHPSIASIIENLGSVIP